MSGSFDRKYESTGGPVCAEYPCLDNRQRGANPGPGFGGPEGVEGNPYRILSICTSDTIK